ncbi:MAG TPA: hypothetical protein DD420_23020 [Streptomyces sp.]|nr:hypothetical protein [Streptomyces sp.]
MWPLPHPVTASPLRAGLLPVFVPLSARRVARAGLQIRPRGPPAEGAADARQHIQNPHGRDVPVRKPLFSFSEGQTCV